MLFRSPASVRDSVVIRIKGDDIDVDFAGASLIGAPYSAASDQAAGIGILVDGGRNITLRGATIRGYRVGLDIIDDKIKILRIPLTLTFLLHI